MNNLIDWKELKKGDIYYLTGEYWGLGKSLINEPVKFTYFEDKDGNEINSVGKKHNCNAICNFVNSNVKSLSDSVQVSSYLFTSPIDVNNKIISRITGELIDKNDRETLNENPDQEDTFNIAFKQLGDILKNEQHNEKYKYNVELLKMKWEFNGSFIEKVYDKMASSFDESDYFLSILDGSDTLEEAWQVYCDDRNISEEFPF